MTREEIIRMAHKAALLREEAIGSEWTASLPKVDCLNRLERFAALVAKHEREACAKIVDANAAACANNSMLQDVLRGNAAAMRARGEKP